MNFIRVHIYYNKIKYDSFYIFENTIPSLIYHNGICTCHTVLQNNVKCTNLFKSKSTKKCLLIYYDGILTHYIAQELSLSPTYRNNFINAVKNITNGTTNLVLIQLKQPEREILDYAWNSRTTHLVREKAELDHALSWLSTLGGAFSALGEYFPNCALTAGKISFHQLKLALRLGDPNIEARCRLYLSLSLIQQGYLRQAKHIVRKEYQRGKSAIVKDTRLIRMCLGIWSKLQYEYTKQKIICVK